MRDHQDRCRELFIDTPYHGEQNLGRMTVQCSSRFIRQDQLGDEQALAQAHRCWPPET